MSEAINLAASNPYRGFTLNLALATATAGISGFTYWSASHINIGDPLWWQGGSFMAGLAAALFTIEATKARRQMHSSASSPTPTPEILALPAPMQTKEQEEPMTTATVTTTTEQAVEAERERLAKAGYSETEISQILIAREARLGAGGQSAASGVLSNLTAVMGHARNFLPSLKADLERMLNPKSSFADRIVAATTVALKASVVGVLVYIVSLECVQLKASVDRARAEACIARQKNAINFSTMNELMSGHLNDLDRECKGL
jgi:hypothetical protein